ncbi:TetR/AcrR family transcriptional regulator [bacterium]|nr:TetR/AcrR family transcriptional regulator [bacterium]
MVVRQAESAPDVPDMRTQILRSATRLFAARGFEATSLAAIADDVGIRKQSVLHHFPSKDALRHEVLEAHFARWKDLVPNMLAAASSKQEGFDAALSELIRFYREDPARARLMSRELLDRPDELVAMFQDHLHPWIGLLLDAIERGKADGVVDPQLDPEAFLSQTVLTVVTLIAGSPIMTQIVPESRRNAAPLDRQIDEMTRAIRRAFYVPRADRVRPRRNGE